MCLPLLVGARNGTCNPRFAVRQLLICLFILRKPAQPCARRLDTGSSIKFTQQLKGAGMCLPLLVGARNGTCNPRFAVRQLLICLFILRKPAQPCARRLDTGSSIKFTQQLKGAGMCLPLLVGARNGTCNPRFAVRQLLICLFILRKPAQPCARRLDTGSSIKFTQQLKGAGMCLPLLVGARNGT